MHRPRLGPYAVATSRIDGDLERLTATAPDGSEVELVRAGEAGDRGRGTERDLLATAQLDHPHVERVVDLFHDPEGRAVLVVHPRPAETALAWLHGQGRLALGELVTVAVPVLSVLGRASAAGFRPAAVPVDDVVVDDRGAPVLRRLRLVRSPVAAEPDVAAAAAATAFVDELSAWLPPEARAAVALAPDASLLEVQETVHDLAAPVPLPTPVGPAGLGRASVPLEAGEALLDGALAPVRPAWAAVLPESDLVEIALDWWDAVRRVSVRERLTAVRPRFWVVGALVVVSAAAAGIALPSETPPPGSRDDSAGPAASESAPAWMPTSASPADGQGSPSGPVVGSPSGTSDRGGGAQEASEAPVAADVDEAAVLAGDDAAGATAVLLRARQLCLRDATPSCLASVDQAGSPAAARDAVVLDDPGAASRLPLPVRVTAEVQRLGDTVLFDAAGEDDEPASVLVVRTEAGWRLREVVARE